jgi:hypothetical protein
MFQFLDKIDLQTSDNVKNRPLTILYVSVRAIILLFLSGAVIGFFHKIDWVIALICIVRILYFIFFNAPKTIDNQTLKIVYLGMAITTVLGVSAELLGIHFGFWEYHNLSDNRDFPYWLPLMWGLSFLFLFRIESRLIRLIKITHFSQKLLITAIVAFTLPTIGEIVAINLGVWTYYNMGPKLLGVPYLAMFLLMILHTGIFTFLTYYCRLKKIETTVFKF